MIAALIGFWLVSSVATLDLFAPPPRHGLAKSAVYRLSASCRQGTYNPARDGIDCSLVVQGRPALVSFMIDATGTVTGWMIDFDFTRDESAASDLYNRVSERLLRRYMSVSEARDDTTVRRDFLLPDQAMATAIFSAQNGVVPAVRVTNFRQVPSQTSTLILDPFTLNASPH